jgi:hypothetical protein
VPLHGVGEAGDASWLCPRHHPAGVVVEVYSHVQAAPRPRATSPHHLNITPTPLVVPSPKHYACRHAAVLIKYYVLKKLLF